MMNRIKIFLCSLQNEFAIERKRIADYIRQDTLPEFHQDDVFYRVVIWKRGNVGVQEDSNIIKIVSAIRGNTVSAKEVKKIMNLKDRSNFTSRYLLPSIKKGYVAPLYPDAHQVTRI